MDSLAETKNTLKETEEELTAWLPDLLYTGTKFESGLALVCDGSGQVRSFAREDELKDFAGGVVHLQGRALLPGLVNAHSHAFQRVIRGRTERRTSRSTDSFWTWREMMYSAATRLSPEDIYDASRMAFLEMALCGITAVGEFHYIHRTPEGSAYDDPNEIAKEVVRAAREVGLRIALLRVAYARSGFQTELNARQLRFIEAEPETYLNNTESLISDLDKTADGGAWAGVAPHSVRAVPLDYLRQVVAFADEQKLPIHMHVAEQPAEVEACAKEHSRTPVALLDAEGLLGERFTAVHAVHITSEEARALSRAKSIVCACPTTERNLGDGIVPAELLFKEGVRVSLGTDSHAQIDLMEDARELEYHLRLQKMERVVLVDKDETSGSSLAARLFDCASRRGAESIGAPSGTLEQGCPADFFTVALDDPSIAGASADDLLASIIFSATRAAVREVFVGGKQVVEDGQHLLQQEIAQRFGALQKRLWE